MKLKHYRMCILFFVILFVFPAASTAKDDHHCLASFQPGISFVEFQSTLLTIDQPPAPLTVKGKLKLPLVYKKSSSCKKLKKRHPAVVILHGSAGIDFRGDFYARALNAAGIATLEIDMWEARGVETAADRPPLPLFTYPDAFAALAFLSNHDAIDPDRIGVFGFSWGGVISLTSAEELYAAQFGGGLKFAAHVAHYPICYGYNSTIQVLQPNAQTGSQLLNLTGAPVLIQIGTKDDYDNGADNCFALADEVNQNNGSNLIKVVAYEGAYHAWDRLLVPITVFDPFAGQGSFFSTGVVPKVEMIPDADLAKQSRKRVVKFFLKNL